MNPAMITVMDKDRLAAFVDGELAPEEAAAVVLHLADHPGDQAWVDDLYAANEALALAFAAPLHEPVPEAIRAAIMGPAATVVAFRPPSQPPSRPQSQPQSQPQSRPRARPRARLVPVLGGLAIAASVALAAVLLPGLAGGPSPVGVALGPLPGTDAVAGVLDARASGAPVQLADGRETMVLASFAMPDGRLCREFEVIDRGAARVDYAVGCRGSEGWTVEAAIAEAIGTGTGTGQDFVPAGEAGADALTRYLERSGAPLALDPAAEAAAIAQGWSGR